MGFTPANLPASLVNDRSTDQTGQIMKRVARESDRLTALNVTAIRDATVPAGALFGGAIVNVSTLIVRNSTFVGNDAVAGDAKVGQEQIINASVIDAGMRQLVGPTATIDMALEDWAALQSTTSTVLVQGTFTAYNPQGWNYPDLTITAPLATEFTYSQGKVVYTAFHNEGQNTFDMDALLKKIVLSL